MIGEDYTGVIHWAAYNIKTTILEEFISMDPAKSHDPQLKFRLAVYNIIKEIHSICCPVSPRNDINVSRKDFFLRALEKFDALYDEYKTMKGINDKLSSPLWIKIRCRMLTMHAVDLLRDMLHLSYWQTPEHAKNIVVTDEFDAVKYKTRVEEIFQEHKIFRRAQKGGGPREVEDLAMSDLQASLTIQGTSRHFIKTALFKILTKWPIVDFKNSVIQFIKSAENTVLPIPRFPGPAAFYPSVVSSSDISLLQPDWTAEERDLRGPYATTATPPPSSTPAPTPPSSVPPRGSHSKTRKTATRSSTPGSAGSPSGSGSVSRVIITETATEDSDEDTEEQDPNICATEKGPSAGESAATRGLRKKLRPSQKKDTPPPHPSHRKDSAAQESSDGDATASPVIAATVDDVLDAPAPSISLAGGRSAAAASLSSPAPHSSRSSPSPASVPPPPPRPSDESLAPTRSEQSPLPARTEPCTEDADFAADAGFQVLVTLEEEASRTVQQQQQQQPPPKGRQRRDITGPRPSATQVTFNDSEEPEQLEEIDDASEQSPKSSSGKKRRASMPSPIRRLPPSMRPPTPTSTLEPPGRITWSFAETEALKNGLATHGYGHWMAIKTDHRYGPLLNGRTNVQLKDKWRNIVKLEARKQTAE